MTIRIPVRLMHQPSPRDPAGRDRPPRSWRCRPARPRRRPALVRAAGRAGDPWPRAAGGPRVRYHGSWSIASLGAPATTSPLWQNQALRTRLGLQIGGGNFDSLTIPAINTYEANLGAAGIPFTDDRIDGGHEWYTWRQLLLDYTTTTMAFRHTSTAVRLAGRRLAIATVRGDTTEPVPPFGTVQFMENGQPAGRPRPLRWGSAVAPLRRLGAGDSVTAVYGGDNYYYNSGTGAAVSAS